MNTNTNPLTGLLNIFRQSTIDGTLVKVTFSNAKNASEELKTVLIKPVIIRERLMLSFVYRYKTKDITKNYAAEEAFVEAEKLLTANFTQAFIATTVNDYQLITNKKGNSALIKLPPSKTEVPSLKHDKTKERKIGQTHKLYLELLGIMNAQGNIKPDMQDKYRQINKYVEIVESILKNADLPENMQITDMGSGKGYLTFALYDYLISQGKKVTMTGVELRPELVKKSNEIALASGFGTLHFVEGAIESTEITPPDVLIALHACDTATDDAILKGITAGSSVILCSPCCHKQVRRDMATEGILSEITQFGILAERQAEILTDTIRALLLEAYGYKTNIAEFIATEHTPKNLIISAIRKKTTSQSQEPDQNIISNINQLRKLFNIKSHYLQQQLENKTKS